MNTRIIPERDKRRDFLGSGVMWKLITQSEEMYWKKRVGGVISGIHNHFSGEKEILGSGNSMESTKLSLAMILSRDMKPELAIFCSKVGLLIEGLEHQPRPNKTLKPTIYPTWKVS